MTAAIALRTDFSAATLRRLATKAESISQSRRLLSLAAILDGMNRTDAARIGGMDRQTLRDWALRFNAGGPDGLKDNWRGGRPSALSAACRAQLADIVDAGPDIEKDGAVRWRCVDLQHVIASRFGIQYSERHVGKILKQIGFSHISARPRHPGQDAGIMDAFKKTSRIS